jgi:hypothetical protein
VWAERRFHKNRLAFSVEDYQRFLQAVRDTATITRQEGTPTGTAEGAATGQPDLWQREEKEAERAEDYGQ